MASRGDLAADVAPWAQCAHPGIRIGLYIRLIGLNLRCFRGVADVERLAPGSVPTSVTSFCSR